MASPSEPLNYDFPRQSVSEEIANSVTHGLGLFLSLAGAVALLLSAYRHSEAWRLLGLATYAASLVAVYASSTLSHAIQHQRWKHWFRVLDQAAIYLLIAGTYTPFILIHVSPARTWPILLLVWGVALLGCISKVILKHRVNAVAVVHYALLGWLPALAMFEWIPATCLLWLFLGGVLYTAGTIFLTFDQRIPFFHTAWHSFVLCGSACHYVAIMYSTQLFSV